MNRDVWKQIVLEARNGNTVLFNKAVTSNFQEHFYTSIMKIVHDKGLTREIYNSTMLKFWERFILKGEDLPESNIDGYIFQMSRNAFYNIKRQRNDQRNLNTVSLESQDLIERYKDTRDEESKVFGEDLQDLGEQKQSVLFQLIQKLDEVCQHIIHRNILDGQSLVKIKEEIQMYGSYNAIVQKKKRCMNMFSKLLHVAIKENKYILPENNHE